LNQPDLIGQPDAATGSACFFWSENGLNHLADAQDFLGMTKRINGPAAAGMADRLMYLARVQKALGMNGPA